MAYDLKITGGTVVDGTGCPGVAADVAVHDGRVVAIGAAPDDARQTVDATGRVVCPGFVDIHTHYDAQILWDRMLTISPWHGVTTVVMGNCGFGIAPTRPEHRSLIVRTLENVEGMSAEALEAGLGEWGFATFPEYLDAVEAQGSAINVAALVGHTPMRLSVLGPEATERAATADELAAMKAVLAEALQAGAIGFATSKSPTHVGFEGRPVPSRMADFAEISALAEVLGEAGRGVMQATIGRELASQQFAEIAARTGRPVSWTALLAGAGGPGAHRAALTEAADIVARGLPVYPQVSCRPLNFEFTLADPFIFASMDVFAPVMAAAPEDRAEIYAEPSFRSAFRGKAGLHRATMGARWPRTVVSAFPPDPALEERSVVELAEERGLDPTELVLDLALESDLAARFRMGVLNTDEDEVAELLVDPNTMLGLSDAGAHASQLCDANFSTHLLSHWVRDKKVLSLEQAVHQLTQQPAEVFGLTDRGLLAEGRPADVVVFDPATVGTSGLRRVHDLPAGADRLVADAHGIDAVVVNGQILRHGNTDMVDPRGPLPGRLLRHGSAS